MSAIIEVRNTLRAPHYPFHRATADPPWMRWIVISVAVLFMLVMFVLPVALIFREAFRRGWWSYSLAFKDEDTMAAVWLTLKVAMWIVTLNTIFGLAAAWCVSRFKFKGRKLLVMLIELPLWVSPVVSGLIYVLLFGAQGIFGSWLLDHGIKIIFGLPGIVLSTIFVTFPFVARVLTPQMESQGSEDEEAAMRLGANGWQMFWRVTIPKIKWGLLYGIILCNARSMGEFGAVSVVSGHVRGETNTLPLQIEVLYNQYPIAPAFALASVLTLLGLVTLVIKTMTDRKR